MALIGSYSLVALRFPSRGVLIGQQHSSLWESALTKFMVEFSLSDVLVPVKSFSFERDVFCSFLVVTLQKRWQRFTCCYRLLSQGGSVMKNNGYNSRFPNSSLVCLAVTQNSSDVPAGVLLLVHLLFVSPEPQQHVSVFYCFIFVCRYNLLCVLYGS